MIGSVLPRLVLLVGAFALGGCSTLDRLSSVGEAPEMASVQDPSKIPNATPVSMPMPAPVLGERQPNSLWMTGSRAFFRDQRASRVGDILTIIITINDKAQLQNETKRSRENAENANVNNVLGFETNMKRWLPKAADLSSLVDTESSMSNQGKGSINRSEQINLRVAGTITQVLPNGNLVIAGKQQVMINYDMRDLQISGVIRPEDISSDNTVTYDQIAEARIAYGGRGTVQDVQQPRLGSQVLDILMPF